MEAIQDIILGIDLGTTSVKVCLLNEENRKVIYSTTAETNADVPSDNENGSEQSVQLILQAVQKAMLDIPDLYKSKVKAIGVCGQMHGCLLWQSDSCWEITKGNYESIQVTNCTPLYTWQDGRCDTHFLQSLPSSQSTVKIATGFGCATLFWLLKNRPQLIGQFDRASTIQDFLVCILCHTNKVVMSGQNATSWGYFDPIRNCWETEVLEPASFPIALLPEVSDAGEKAGYLQQAMWGLKAGIPVSVASGDMQCSIYSALKDNTDAVMNISTSAQLAFVASHAFIQDNLTVIPASIQIQPFFQKSFISVAAALNGGNALAAFVDLLASWMKDLAVVDIPNKEELFDRILRLASSVESVPSLKIEPILLGERHDPKRRGCVSHITPHNLQLSNVANGLLYGIIHNLNDMMPGEFLRKAGIRRIVGSGRLLASHAFIRDIVESQFHLPVTIGTTGDAATGAALAVMLTRR
ncbi:Sedoheptulokinase [Trichoplax sp. H2]|nr:Sedoheptulokinase [Trichoplax sp. H2]|eukprot:RDD42892.1 Sedoheptulokinase [Trichoplax sp. H2]